MKFADIKSPRRGALAQQGWLILIGHAKNWQVTTYERIGNEHCNYNFTWRDGGAATPTRKAEVQI